MHTAVTTATVVLTNTNAGQSVCPTQQPCLFSGGPGMVTVTESETTTAVVTEIANHGETLGVTLVSYSNPGVSVVIVTVTSTDPQQTVTKTVTAEASTETVVATVTQTSIELDEKSQDDVILSYLDTTVVETVMVSIESPSDAAGSPPNGWMTALIVVVVLAVLIMLAVVGYIYYRWRAKKRAEHNATTVRALRQHSAYFDPVTK
ncbi:hypothetical protein H4R19_001693 [Coemansia spiralis]|nr:hypothetical protein H4R19_001693 [Coemansia spiralis]